VKKNVQLGELKTFMFHALGIEQLAYSRVYAWPLNAMRAVRTLKNYILRR
jgi:hypothetical protein